jgi:biopolymer transport protein ExbD
MDDSMLNMTPMIDVVFQLILFFLFSLKFKSLDYRFESELPKNVGPHETSLPAEVVPRLSVALYRLDEIDPAKARTKMKFAGAEWIVPDVASYDERDKTFASLREKLRQVSRATSVFEGEIKTPLPSGAAVPHADVMKVLDAFIEAEIANVKFEGAASPLPGRH